MLGYTHIATGIASSVIISNCMFEKQELSILATVLIGGIAGIVPDVDLPSFDEKKQQRRNMAIFITFILLAIISFLLYESVNFKIFLASIGLFIMTTLFCATRPHREFSHSILSLCIFSLSVFLLDPYLGTLFSASYCSHLFLDIFNRKGIALFILIPKLKRKRISLNIVESNNNVINPILASLSAIVTLYYLFNGIIR